MNNSIKIFIISFISFMGVFLRPDLFGFDSYATWYVIKTGVNDVLSNQPWALQIFSFLPDNLFIFKLLMFVCFFVSLLVLYFTLKHYFGNEKLAFYGCFGLIALSPLLMFEFAKFENELFAWPIILLAMYVFINWSSWKKLFSIIPLYLSTFFWMWPGYLTWFGGNVLEQRIFGGLLPLFGLLPMILFIVFEKKWFYKFFCLFFLGLFMLVPKLWVFYVPFLGLSVVYAIKFMVDKQLFERNILLDKNNAIMLLFFGLCAWNIAIYMQQPTANDWDLINEALELHEDNNYPIYNDWSIGHWLRIRGYETKYRSGGYNPDYNSLEKPFIGVTQENLDCNIHSKYTTWIRQLKIYECS